MKNVCNQVEIEILENTNVSTMCVVYDINFKLLVFMIVESLKIFMNRKKTLQAIAHL